jgi:FAD dependent oxidoreductase
MREVDADVLVVGAGSAGCAAAVAAGRAGARTVLVDRLPFVGGTSTAVLDTFYAFWTAGERPRQVVRGIGQLVVEALERRAACFWRPNTFGSGLGLTYDQEALKLVWDELLDAAGVRVLTGAVAFEAAEQDDHTAVGVAAKGGRLRLRARAAVDASGDGDLSMLLGAGVLPDRELVQPATSTFKLANVDTARAFPASGRRPLRAWIEEARSLGYELPAASGSMHRTTAEGVVLALMTRVPSPDPDDPDAWRAAEAAARRQVEACVRFLRERVPGFGHAALVSTSPMLGVRETRRVRGRRVLSEQDVLAAVTPADAVALCGAPVEDLAREPTRWVHVPEPGFYGIGFDCLRPLGLRDVLVAGRCFSADHGAHSSARSMATCMALGHAAGLAGAVAARTGACAAELDPLAVRDALAADGAVVAAEQLA